ncbi:MAG: hypothetical protein QGG67_18445 [Gammaproteobacteria bacterium]|jgi:DUF4097 and DUF4098 domain-containing protein YvlB|nr:hypothetical protein [Gammaproteobacteria bacterium]MDP6097943.1 hypothetical protein [Gammaproteobacteria bacterium]MDP7456237.1 hypothetical protein [Gammaproteobacteria bacterium]|tara:strand:- start:633 stop:1310 length:678 start_codon:yes stop_codon:yes gene_type:complete
MRVIKYKENVVAATMLAMFLGGYLYTATADGAELRDISKINGSIRVDAQTQVGDISSINGGVGIGSGASASDIKTVNGGINLSDHATIGSARTVNGGIRTSEEVIVNGSLSTVNGRIVLEPRSVVRESVTTVNGRIQLSNTRIGENIQSSNGDITIRDNSTVEGDIVVKRNRGSWFSRFFNRNRNSVEITIDASSSVQGDIHLYKEVDLDIDDNANVGEIIRHYL